jgi:glycosyltransferase involved in cell wall biosynthesis
MKILFIADVDLSLPGGLETHLLELSRGLAARGHEVHTTARASRPPADLAAKLVRPEEVDPATYDVLHHHGGPWPKGWRRPHRAGRAAAGRAPDAQAPASTPAPYLRTFHFSVAAKMGVYLRMGRVRTLFNPGNHRALAEERAALRLGRRFVAVSRSLRDELVRFHGVTRESIEIIPNGASFAQPRLGRSAWRQKQGIAADAPLLLTIGRDDFVKGFDLLARAWERAAPTRPPGALWVRVGGQRPARTESTLTTGPIPPGDVTEWIHAADVGAFPSYYEGGGIALTDMLAGGLYALTHAVGVAPEVVRPGVNGEFVSRRDEAWAEALARSLARPTQAPAHAPTQAPTQAPAKPALPPLGPEWTWTAISARVEEAYGRLRG